MIDQSLIKHKKITLMIDQDLIKSSVILMIEQGWVKPRCIAKKHSL